uniref:Uncharacterized protein n=1 Tax=Paramoeba aestuarina TaxID=180227 RepID=A0A7S4NU55_9EUKA|mmetsp:Transcript_26756/g.41709  ORF Transcript_26756/g.41709 Transcript_26756/m.41709 type:complete len:225 (+) Transcript_26756:28-702(+)
MIFCATLLALDLDPQVKPQKRMRDALMERFFENISQEGILKVSHGARVALRKDICHGWDGITCLFGEIVAIKYIGKEHGDLQIGYMPNTAQWVSIISCFQRFTISIRSFPRNLITISLGNNLITGRPDLTVLPEKLEEAEFWSNRLNGPIQLTHLPRKLRKLNLRGNMIDQHTVWYDDLPETIEEIRFRNVIEKTKIREVRAVHPYKAVKRKEIFYGMNKSHVH